MSSLDQPLGTLLGPRTAKELDSGLGLRTVGDLLRHYPRRYARRGELTDLADLEVGEHSTVVATVRKVTLRDLRKSPGGRTGRGGAPGQMLTVVVGDGRRELTLVFFGRGVHVPGKELTVGREGLFAGKVSMFNGTRQLSHPEYLLFDGEGSAAEGSDTEGSDAAAAFARALIPVYPATDALPTWKISKAVRALLDLTADLDDELLPTPVRESHGLLPLPQALRWVHEPQDAAQVAVAHDRLRWDEAFPLQVVLAQRRASRSVAPALPRPGRPGGLRDAFLERLPFALTAGQQEVATVLADELARPHPMNRLLQGEVGSGKTVVALLAMLQVVDSGGQAALLAPTEVLAAQHVRSITAFLGPLAQAGMLGGSDVATRVALLTGSQGAAERRRNLLDAASGAAGIVIGTHALLQEHVQLADLGLVVVDEQHRFGVEQRDALRSKAGTPPHVLVMTATPIPRTVAMTVFGDLEVSTLTELPRGRSPIVTHVVPAGDKPHFLARAWERLREEVAAGHQGYVVCPRIGAAAGPDGDDAPVAAAEPDPGQEGRGPGAGVLDVAPALADGPLAGLRLGVLHGRLPAEEKDDVMRRFTAGELDVLVATTVIEVGVDVPNATVMTVLDADRFGVSQLHQLRGRVGRGGAASICLLVTELAGGPSRERLEAVAATTDGFELSRIDLEARREGDVLGTSQSGRRTSLRLLSVLRDEATIRAAREEASALVARDPQLAEAPAELRRVVATLLDDERSEFLEKA